MFVSRLFATHLGIVCATALLCAEFHAGQCQPPCGASQPCEMVTATYAVADPVSNSFFVMPVTIYPIADLVLPIDTLSQGAKTPEENIMTLIRALVDPASWQDNGGEASLHYSPLYQALVVGQWSDQERAAELLETLRKSR
jgi:hypothetical protein